MYPTGTVTFLFSDIEGSTQLARNFPEQWPVLRARHHALLKSAITAHHGYLFRTVGDEVNAAFEVASDALAAAHDGQFALLAEDWGAIGSLRVRMGLHTGPAKAQSGEYEGYLTLSHVKRLMSAASGGQVLVSEATAAILGEAVPKEISLGDLGMHHLRDFERAEHIYQLVASDLPAGFPPLSTREAPPSHLPVQLTSFVGRIKELNEVQYLLSKGRLVTLTGPSGSGKTRLALQVAAKNLEHFQDGIFFVPLGPVTDPGLIPSVIAQSLNLPETPRRSILASVKDNLQNKTLLLLLDNFEQVISAEFLVTELLQACQKIKILVTSREGLHVSGEQEYPVPPLALPNLAQPVSIETISKFPSVELFVQRAVAVKPDFRLTDDFASSVAEICRRLDGLPLAIELAAARIKLLSPPAMLTRLEHRLEFLTGGARDLPARQQTLRNAIAWSYDLLHEKERIFFQRLSVFVGGCTLAAAEAVAGDSSNRASVLDLIESLLDKSLLYQMESLDGETRFAMLQTLREFGLEQLEVSGEHDAIRLRHAEFYLILAEQAAANFGSAEQVDWVHRLEQEHDNLRTALEWSSMTPGASDLCLRLANSLGLFWETRGYFSEGRERLSAILSTSPALERTIPRARLLARAAELAYRQSDYSATDTFAGESLAIYREQGDQQGTASTLIKLANSATETGDYTVASDYLEEALTIWRTLEDRHGTARALISLGWIALRQGNYSLARARLSEALALSRELGDTKRVGFELSGLGEIDLRQGDFTHAAQLVEESLRLRRELGNQWGVGVCLGILGWIAIRQGAWERAIAYLSESLQIRREIGDQSGSAWCLEHLAGISIARGQEEKATRLLGAGAALRTSIGSVIDPADQPEYQKQIKFLRDALGVKRFTTAWKAGQALTLDQAVAYATE